MLQIDRPFDQYAGQGWALFDWNYHATRPQLLFRAGNMDATRLQFDAYRRWLHVPHWAAQIQLWCWCQNDFRIEESRRIGSNPTIVATHYPTAFPESLQTVVGVAVREYRFAAGAAWTQGSYQNNYTTSNAQLTIADRYFGVFEFRTTTQIPGGFDPFGIKLDLVQPNNKSTIRVLALGHHNHVWQTGGIS